MVRLVAADESITDLTAEILILLGVLATSVAASAVKTSTNEPLTS